MRTGDRSGMLKPESVQLEGVTFMKMLRHAELLLSSQNDGSIQQAEGKLVGLLNGSTMEVTNCFPSPLWDESEDSQRRSQTEHNYQIDVLHNLRMFKQDYVAVGWYTTASVANFATKSFVEHQFEYQQNNEDSVVLVIDLNKLALLKANPSTILAPFSVPPCLVRAYRLTDNAMALYESNVFSPKTMKQHGLTFENIFEQFPVTVHNSDLANVMLHQFGALKLSKKKQDTQTSQQQVLSSLQRHLRDLSTCADEMSNETQRATTMCTQHNRYLQSRQQYVSRRDAENRSKAQRNEAVLPVTEDEIANNVRQPPPIIHLPTLLLASQMSKTAEEASRVSGSVLQRNLATHLMKGGNQ